jgi:hypothetical protein
MNKSPMHEYHLSLNGKYRNTHFALNEEQVGLLTYTTLYLASRPNYTWRVRKWERRGLGMLWCVSILTPSTSIYRPGSLRENTPKHPGNALRIQRGDDTQKMGANRLTLGLVNLLCRPIPSRFRLRRLSSG